MSLELRTVHLGVVSASVLFCGLLAGFFGIGETKPLLASLSAMAAVVVGGYGLRAYSTLPSARSVAPADELDGIERER